MITIFLNVNKLYEWLDVVVTIACWHKMTLVVVFQVDEDVPSVYRNLDRGKKKKISLVPRASLSKFLLVLLPNNLSLSRKNILALSIFTCPPDIGWKYMLVLPEIQLVPGTRTSDFFTPAWDFLWNGPQVL